MLNKIDIHYITTLFVLELLIISCWLLKGKKIGIGIGIGQFARKKIGIGIGHEKSWSVHHYTLGLKILEPWLSLLAAIFLLLFFSIFRSFLAQEGHRQSHTV